MMNVMYTLNVESVIDLSMVRQYEYSIALGKKLSNQLLQKSRGVLKLTDPEWQEIYDTYKTKLEEIKKQQNF